MSKKALRKELAEKVQRAEQEVRKTCDELKHHPYEVDCPYQAQADGLTRAIEIINGEKE